MCAFTRTALCRKGISVAAMAHARSVYKHGLVKTAGEGECEHQGIVQPEHPHRLTTVESALALCEFLVADKEAAGLVVDVAYHVLIAAVRKQIHGGDTVAGVGLTHQYLFLLRLQIVIYANGEKQFITLCFLRFERFERRKQIHVVDCGVLELNADVEIGNPEIITLHLFSALISSFLFWRAAMNPLPQSFRFQTCQRI